MIKTSKDILVEHAMNTLPESIQERKVILEAIFSTISPKHPAFTAIETMIRSLTEHEAAQSSLPLFTIKGAAAK